MIVAIAEKGTIRDGKSIAMGRPPLPIKGGAGVDVTAASRTALYERCILSALPGR